MPKNPKRRKAGRATTQSQTAHSVPETPSDGLPERWHRGVFLAILAAYVLVSRLLLWSYVPVDDAFISYRYAHHLASGEGLTFNPGEERVEGYSSLSWVLLLAAADRLGLSLLEFSKWLGLLLGVGTLLLFSRGPLNPRVRLLAAALLALYLPAGYHFINGLETSLMAFEVTALVLLSFRSASGRWLHHGITALLVLTRPEGLLCVLLWGGALWVMNRRGVSLREMSLGLTALATYAAQTAFRWWYYGDWIANSARAKLLPIGSSLGPGLADLGRFAVQGSAYGLLLLLFFVGAALSWRRRSTAQPEEKGKLLAMALFVVSFGLTLAVSGGDSFPLWRFYVPLSPLFFLGSAQGLDLVSRAGRRRASSRPSLSLWATAALVLAITLWLPYRKYRQSMEGEAAWSTHWEDVGRSLARTFPPDTRIALCPAGALPFRSGLPTIDMLGLNEPRIARKSPDLSYFYPGHHRHDGPYVLSLEPDLVMLANGPAVPKPGYPFPWQDVRVYERDVMRDPRFRSHYRLIHVPLESGRYVQLFARTELLERTGDLPGVTVTW